MQYYLVTHRSYGKRIGNAGRPRPRIHAGHASLNRSRAAPKPVPRPQSKKFPPIPKAGIDDEWVEKVLAIDPHIKPWVQREKPGVYTIGFYKVINGAETPIMFSPGFYLENILELLNKQSQDFDIVDEEQHVSSVKGIWGKMEAEEALSDPALQEDLNVFRKKYSKEELSKTPLANLNLIAKIKAGSELAGGLVKWNREGTAIVKVKEGPLTNDEKLERLIEIILRHERAKV